MAEVVCAHFAPMPLKIAWLQIVKLKVRRDFLASLKRPG